MKREWILIFFLTIITPIVSWGAEPSGVAAVEKAAASEPNGVNNCQNLTTAVRENQASVSRDLRQIKRDLAELQQKLNEPGMGQIFSGIGYIFGLFGVAAFVASRKK